KKEEPQDPAQPAEPQAEEIDKLKDRLLRLQADFDNFRKRTQREKAEMYARANEDIVSELLTVIDHFERGLATSLEHKTEDAVHGGFRMVYEQLLGTLKKFGVTPVDAHEAMFDPHLHEAVSHVPSDEYVADQIVTQLRRGYRLGDRLIRPVQVVVSSGPGALRDDGEKPGDPAPPAAS
ncbi:MAG TPA: nucleotide exchange factor GrpE, partial [Kiritimatiellia bacterium]